MTNHNCSICNKGFKTADALEMHSRAKHQTLSSSQKSSGILKIALISATLIILVILGFMLFDSDKRNLPQKPYSPFDIKNDDWVFGNNDSPVTLIEYLDFECEVCGVYYPLVKELKEEYKSAIRVVIRYYPLPGHPNSMTAARIVEAAGKQGKFWEMHNLLFETQKNWGERKQSDDYFLQLASTLSLDMVQLKADFKSDEVLERVTRDKLEGTKIGVSGTPSFFLNGKKLQNPRSIADFKTLINAAILQNPIKQNESDLIHEHADFKVVLNGTSIDFNQSKYQSTEDKEYHPYTHMHSGIGYILHKHKKGITVKDFFNSVNITFNSTCLVMDTNHSYCNDEQYSLKFFVNGTKVPSYENYELKNLDRILISYGQVEDSTLVNQTESVTDIACMFSELCPERGAPPTEECVGGLGSECH